MGERDREERLEQLIGSLVARRMEESLARVEQGLAAWRSGEAEMFSAHAEVLRHAARTGALSSRVARVGIDGPERLLRDAFDEGLVEREEFVQLVGKKPEDVAPLPTLDVEAEHATHGDGPPLPPKKDVVEKLLEDGPVLIHLDARKEHVRVPSQHGEDPKLVLRIGWRLTPPIHDLSVDDEGVRATLSFRGVPFSCVVPWSAIYAVVGEDGRGLVWPGDVPTEVDRRNGSGRAEDSDSDEESDDEPEPPPSKPRRHLKLV